MLVSKLVPVAAVIIGIVLSATGLFGYKIAARESDPPTSVSGETQAPVEFPPDKPKPPLTPAKEPEQRKPSAKEAAANDRMEVVLREWAKADRDINDLHCKFRLISEDRVYGTKETKDGEAWIKKPDLWRIDIKPARTGATQIYVLTDKEVGWTHGSEKVHILALPPKGIHEPIKFLWGTFDLASLLRATPFGIPVGDLQTYYAVRLVGEDKYYSYIELLPKSDNDRASFTSTQLALTRKTQLLRLFTHLEPNGNRITWDILDLQTNVNPPITRAIILKNLHLDRGEKK